MQYKIVDAGNQYDLSIKVRDELKNGWRPQGGVSFAYHSGYKETWVQAMVKGE